MATPEELYCPLTVITDESLPAARIEAIVGSASRGGPIIVQLRARGWSGRGIYSAAERLRELTRQGGCKLVVHERVDVAIAVGADGVHLPATGMPPRKVRALLDAHARSHATLGLSVHSIDEIRRLDAAIDTVHFGPVFPTPSKEGFGPPQGIEGLRLAAEAAAANRVRIVAVGGITPERAVLALEAGADGVAVIRAVMGAVDPAAVVRAFADAFKRVRT